MEDVQGLLHWTEGLCEEDEEDFDVYTFFAHCERQMNQYIWDVYGTFLYPEHIDVGMQLAYQMEGFEAFLQKVEPRLLTDPDAKPRKYTKKEWQEFVKKQTAKELREYRKSRSERPRSAAV